MSGSGVSTGLKVCGRGGFKEDRRRGFGRPGSASLITAFCALSRFLYLATRGFDFLLTTL